MNNNPNLETKLQLGIAAAQQGNKEGAQLLLRQVLEEDPRNDRAWLWMAVVEKDKKKKMQYLNTVLKINPNHAAARKALRQISSKRSRSEQRTLLMGSVVLLMILVVSTLLCLVAVLAR